MRARAALLLAAVLLAPGTLAACGVSTGGAPSTIAASEVPYGLVAPSSSAPPASTGPTREDRPRIYLVSTDGILVPSGRTVSGNTPADRLGDLLGQLATGPTSQERTDHLATALPPDTRLTVSAVKDGTATVALSGSDHAPSGKQSRRAVGQIVLTATSLPGVQAVLLQRDGQPVEAPLPSGELTSAPLTAADYDALLVAQPS